jgi:two-component system sensor histidine kinase HydH
VTIPRLARKNLPLIVALGALFLLVTALSIFILRRETDRNRILMEWDASRLASLLLEVYLDRGAIEDPEVVRNLQRVVGFGIYGPGGDLQTRYRGAPRDLARYDVPGEGELYVRDRGRGTLVHIRPVAHLTEGMMRVPRLLSRLTMRFVYIEVDVRDSLRRQSLYNAALAAVPLAIAVLTVLAGAYALKNAQYREQIVSQERLARLGEAARTLAHELKNPLNVIKLRARLARRATGDVAAADLDVVEHEVEHLAGLTDRIREFLQDPVGSPEPIELEGYVRDLVSRSGWEAVVSTDGATRYPVYFDASRLRSVVENLVRNARESMEPEPGAPPTGSVEIRLRRERDAVALSVLDRGRGLDPALGDRLFDPFYTTKTTGSGIGLSIGRRFVEARGGSIVLVKRDGGGTEALVTLKATSERGSA